MKPRRLKPNELVHPPLKVEIHHMNTGEVRVVEGDEPHKETIWEELQRFIGSIQDEIKSENPDPVAIDFWLFKIERRVAILKKHFDET